MIDNRQFQSSSRAWISRDSEAVWSHESRVRCDFRQFDIKSCADFKAANKFVWSHVSRYLPRSASSLSSFDQTTHINVNFSRSDITLGFFFASIHCVALLERVTNTKTRLTEHLHKLRHLIDLQTWWCQTRAAYYHSLSSFIKYSFFFSVVCAVCRFEHAWLRTEHRKVVYEMFTVSRERLKCFHNFLLVLVSLTSRFMFEEFLGDKTKKNMQKSLSETDQSNCRNLDYYEPEAALINRT